MPDQEISGVALGIIAVAYFIPTIIAIVRSHRSKLAIIAVNTLIGWTLVGYFWALIWSLTGNVRGEK